MANVANYVNVTISIQDISISAPSFNEFLILAESTLLPGAGVQAFDLGPTGLEAYTSAGGLATDSMYQSLAVASSQTPHAPQALTYSRGVDGTALYTLTPLKTTVGYTYRFLVQNTIIEYEVDTGDTVELIATALTALVDAVAGVAATDLVGSFSIAPDDQIVCLEQVEPAVFTIETGTPTNSITADLDAARGSNPDFYGIVLDSSGETDILDAAAWAEANRKILLVRCEDTDNLAGAGVLDALNTSGYHRTGFIWSTDQCSPVNAALMARQMAFDPGASSFGKQVLPGVAADKLTATEYNALVAKNGIAYDRTRGVAFTSHGKAVSGRQLHITRNVDWLQSRIETRLLKYQVESEILTYDQPTLETIRGKVAEGLQEAQRMGVILPGWTTAILAKDDQTPSDITAGVVRGVTFQAQAARAIEQIFINGVVS